MNILSLDIGSGTQDVLYYSPDMELENCPKVILPSPALQVARRIKAATDAGLPVWLHGHNMGGGFFRALKPHLEKGLKVAAQPSAAFSIFDDPARVEAMGITLSETRPDGYEAVYLADYDEAWWRRFLEVAELEYPDVIMACAQDHGHHPGESNRMGRFKLWTRFLEEHDGDPAELVFETPPAELTRLIDLQGTINGGLVADTGAAAALGVLFDEEIAAESHERGLTLVNAGNSHTIAFLIHKEHISGIYEHHTGMLDKKALWADMVRFRAGELTQQDVFDSGGHGCMTRELPQSARGFETTLLIGPQRNAFKTEGVSLPAPGGDMMLTGSFGMIKGWEMRRKP